MDRSRREFALAPMSPLILWLTGFLCLVPAGLAAAALATGSRVLWIPALGTALLYAGVWLACRPSRFVVSEQGLDLVFPVWTRSIAAGDLTGVRLVSAEAFRAEFGRALRIGVGGLWGGFGWLWTSQRGFVEFYVSRTDGLVFAERRSGRPLLLTPEQPAAMVRALTE
jgi:hypothetical protein